MDSSLFARLPQEIVEHILTLHVNSFGDCDPVHQWTQFRKLSSHQRRRMEKYFAEFWLEKLTISMEAGTTRYYDYRLKQRPDGDVAHFEWLADQYQSESNRADSFNILHAKWNEYRARDTATIGNVILRFGMGFLNDSLRGGHIISDVELVGLTVEIGEGKSDLRIKWKDTLDAMFAEEMYLRRIRERMLNEALDRWNEEKPGVPISLGEMVKILFVDIKHQSRVALLQKRWASGNPSHQPMFHERSQRYHRQTPTILIPQDHRTSCCYCREMMRMSNSVSTLDETEGRQCDIGHDIFAIAAQEESMVLYVPGWRTLGPYALMKLFAEESGWRYCFYNEKFEDRELQQNFATLWLRRPEVFTRRIVIRLVLRWGEQYEIDSTTTRLKRRT